MRRPTLAIMLKAPIAGAVKTRLARGIGTNEALRFYRTASAALIRRVGHDPRWRTVLAIAPDRAAQARFWSSSLERRPQGPGDLGRRMQHLFDTLPHGPVAIIGSDIPDIRADHIASAFRALRDHDAVFGPADDGGYWLIGLKRFPKILRPFPDVRWSSTDALADTLSNLRGLRISRLPFLADVDRAEDWRDWRRASGAHRGGA